LFGSSDAGSGGRITLKVRLFGTFGYQEAGLFDQYTAQHPNIRIEYSTIQDLGQYWTSLQTSLSTESGLGDIQGIEVGDITDVTRNHGRLLRGPRPAGRERDEGPVLPVEVGPGPDPRRARRSWVWALTSDRRRSATGTDLFAKAGLPTKRADVAALWKNGWDGYVAAGERFKAANLPGTSWTDTRPGCSTPWSGSRRTSTTTCRAA